MPIMSEKFPAEEATDYPGRLNTTDQRLAVITLALVVFRKQSIRKEFSF
jgi:hypothetical protein